MLRAVIFSATALTATPTLADGCADYLRQKKANVELGMSALAVQTDLNLFIALNKLDPEVAAAIVKARDDLLKAVTKSTDEIVAIRATTDCP